MPRPNQSNKKERELQKKSLDESLGKDFRWLKEFIISNDDIFALVQRQENGGNTEEFNNLIIEVNKMLVTSRGLFKSSERIDQLKQAAQKFSDNGPQQDFDKFSTKIDISLPY